MLKEVKEENIAALKLELAKAASLVVTDCRCITVKADTALRREFRANGCQYQVVKNTLLSKAIAGTAMKIIDPILAGPTAIAYSYEDPAAAAKIATKDVPIVLIGAGDPVATGLVEGVGRPGGNITGLSELSTELSAKRLEILRDAVPGLHQVAMLWNAADLGMTLRYRSAEDAARLLGFKVQTLGVREPDDFEHAFGEMTRNRPDGILMVSDALTNLNRKRVVEFAMTQRLPTIFELSNLVRDGGLMSYGPKQSELGERAADFVARILRGARPGDLPLELPTRFEFLVNLKTARSLDLTIPPTLLARADEVIE